MSIIANIKVTKVKNNSIVHKEKKLSLSYVSGMDSQTARVCTCEQK